LDKIFAVGLTINPEKCEFCHSQVRYLGFTIQRDDLRWKRERRQNHAFEQIRAKLVSAPMLSCPDFIVPFLHHLKNPIGRLTRWALELLEYDYETVHRKDALSCTFENDTGDGLITKLLLFL
ncbi:hypothetical protein ALC56_11801, partial [Trachymyrmex septentrionalis]